jgi:hypothetical protein
LLDLVFIDLAAYISPSLVVTMIRVWAAARVTRRLLVGYEGEVHVPLYTMDAVEVNSQRANPMQQVVVHTRPGLSPTAADEIVVPLTAVKWLEPSPLHVKLHADATPKRLRP